METKLKTAPGFFSTLNQPEQIIGVRAVLLNYLLSEYIRLMAEAKRYEHSV